MLLKDWYHNNKNTLYFGVLIIILLTIIFGVIVSPSLFYDQWIWKYYWGPVVADASGGTASYNGVTAIEGYTLISEITYGILLIISLYLIYKLLKKLEIVVDWRFALALMPYIVFGPVTRVLEDTGYFSEPYVYWFISPLIYVQIAAYAIFFLILGHYIERKLKNKRLTTNTILFSAGVLILLPAVYLIGSWIAGNQWGDGSTQTHFDVFLIILVLVSFITVAVYLFANKFQKNKNVAVYKNPLNLAMLVGHLVDGITSYISIHDPLNMGLHYIEKHPASDLLMKIWGPLFPITKFLLIIFVIYIFDILYKKELKQYSRLVNLLKIGILILGFSPGLRDLIRATMGV